MQLQEHLFPYGADVQEDHVGVFGSFRQLIAARGAQHLRHLARVVLVHLATEGLDEQLARHMSFQLDPNPVTKMRAALVVW